MSQLEQKSIIEIQIKRTLGHETVIIYRQTDFRAVIKRKSKLRLIPRFTQNKLSVIVISNQSIVKSISYI